MYKRERLTHELPLGALTLHNGEPAGVLAPWHPIQLSVNAWWEVAGDSPGSLLPLGSWKASPAPDRGNLSNEPVNRFLCVFLSRA